MTSLQEPQSPYSTVFARQKSILSNQNAFLLQISI